MERSRLWEALDRGGEAKLTLVSAPAGFGKTTLLADWPARSSTEGHAVAWLSLDESDNEPSTFWTHVVATLQAAAKRSGRTFPESPGPIQPDDGFIAMLINHLASDEGWIILALDDFHLVDRADIQAQVSYLIEHLPPQVRLIISTRSDPTLPLARLRARGDLVEIRATDLRFTPAEASVYLGDIMQLALSPEDATLLEAKTEGWIAALQLAAISMEGRTDASTFIASFAGSGRFVVDYLVEEVLQRLPEDLRHFLTVTCILRRMTAPLCDVILGEPGIGRKMLDRLDRQNLFLVQLDDRRQWYRYHHLFADVLQSHPGASTPSEHQEIHRRASEWLEANGERAEAIHHALAGRHLEWAAELIERAIPYMRLHRQEAAFRTWVQQVPDAVLRTRPILGVAYVGVLLSLGEFEGIEDLLADAELQVQSGAVSRDLLGHIELYRAALAQVRGDMVAAGRHARQVLEFAPPDDHLARAGTAGFLGIVSWAAGDLPHAAEYWKACRTGLRHQGHVADVQGTSIALADILTTLGRLFDARQVCEALSFGTHGGQAVARGVADMHSSLSLLYLERGDLAAARAHLANSLELGGVFGLPQYAYRSCVVQAQFAIAETRYADAAEHLREAERRYVSDFFPNVRPIPAMMARLRVRLGQLDEAERWAREVGVATDDAPIYLREFEHLALARLRIAQAVAEKRRAPEALRLLDRLHAAAAEGGRAGSIIQICVLKALAHRLSNDGPAAFEVLRVALELAAPQGIARPFLDEADALDGLLRLAAKRDPGSAFLRKLLAGSPVEGTASSAHPDLIEALSDRELDVLRLLRGDLSGPEIAVELAVSLNTVRTHTKNIYEKLGVSGRRAAVSRAEAMNLFARNSR